MKISRKVDNKFELAAVTKAIQKTSNKAAFFENVKGTSIPVITNIYNTEC